MSGLKSLWAETPTVAGPLANNTGEVVHAVAAWANDMHRSLSKIHHNTSQGFFWAMFFVVGGLGVALLSTLNDLLRELKKTNEHQVAYRDMWVDERQEMHDQIRADEQSRKNLFMMLSQQIAAASRGGGGGGGGVGGGHVRRVQAQPPETSEETKARMKAYIRGAAAGLPPSFGSRVGSSSGYQGPPDPEEAD